MKDFEKEKMHDKSLGVYKEHIWRLIREKVSSLKIHRFIKENNWGHIS